MKDHILQFVNILRSSGIRISPEEVLDSLVGMEHVDLINKRLFRTLLQTTLIKREDNIKAFNRLFDLYFKAFEIPEEDLPSPLSQTDWEEPLQELMEQLNGLLSPGLRKLVLQGLPALSSSLLESGQRVGLEGIRFPLQASHFVQKIRRDFGMENWAEEVSHLLARMEGEGIPESNRARIEEEILRRIQLFDQVIKDYVDRQAQAFMQKKQNREPHAELMEKGFGALTDWEIRSMQQVIRELVKKIRDESSLRQRRHRKDRFDLKHTLRKSLRYGGVPLEIAFRKRKKSKTRIVTLCDVSSSVWNASRFMLHLLYSLQDQFDKVRSFVFVDQPGEVTGFFERHEVKEAIENALNNADIPYNRYTDYGSVFKDFCEKHMDAVNRRTTFIVIGDGRNNFFFPGDDSLARIRTRARRVIWLNPESRGFWKFGDSMMHRYIKQCDEARECRNLKQLIEFVNQLTF